MCGRFSQAYTWEEIFAFSQPLVEPAARPNLQARYNIAPTTDVDIIVRTPAGREMRKARWGLVPEWWKQDIKKTGATFNARMETADTSGMFRRAWVKRRCIIPASGYYEWTGPTKERVPHYFSAAGGELLGFAGLWEAWTSPEGEEIVSCTIITREPTPWAAQYHDRMPAMLQPRDFDAWLDGSGGKDLLMQPPPELRQWIVSQRVNKSGAGDDEPSTIAPLVD